MFPSHHSSTSSPLMTPHLLRVETKVLTMTYQPIYNLGACYFSTLLSYLLHVLRAHFTLRKQGSLRFFKHHVSFCPPVFAHFVHFAWSSPPQISACVTPSFPSSLCQVLFQSSLITLFKFQSYPRFLLYFIHSN